MRRKPYPALTTWGNTRLVTRTAAAMLLAQARRAGSIKRDGRRSYILGRYGHQLTY